jgi:hypothetical protein
MRIGLPSHGLLPNEFSPISVDRSVGSRRRPAPSLGPCDDGCGGCVWPVIRQANKPEMSSTHGSHHKFFSGNAVTRAMIPIRTGGSANGEGPACLEGPFPALPAWRILIQATPKAVCAGKDGELWHPIRPDGLHA